MNFSFRSILLSLLSMFLLSSIPGNAAVRLPRLISDCMVLQRDAPLNIWGWADPGEKVTVRFDGQHFFTQAGTDGRWSVKLPALKAGGPYLLEVNEIAVRDVLVGDVWLLSGQSNQETPIERLLDKYPEINYSNNHMIRMYKVPTQNTPGTLQEDTPEGERWHSGVASDILNWKALAYWYAALAYAQTGIPQGMLVSSLGGSEIQSWVSEKYLLRIPAIAASKQAADDRANSAKDQGEGKWQAESLDDSGWASVEEPAYLSAAGIGGGVLWFRKTIDVPESMAGRHARIYMGRMVDSDQVYVNGVLVGTTSYAYPPRKYNIPAGVLHEGRNVVAVRLVANASDAGFVPDKPYKIGGDEASIDLTGTWKYKFGQKSAGRAGMPMGGPGGFGQRGFTGGGLFNGMIWPLRDYNVAGVIWYQGESDSGRSGTYVQMLTSLIENWREDMGQGQLPFLICQLPNFMEKHPEPTDSDWARIREAQFKVSRSVPNTALAVCYNLGEWNDIHPLDKKDLASILLLDARGLYNKEKVIYRGPEYSHMKVDGSSVILYFDSPDGLRARGGKLQHFAIAGADRKFVWADAVIKGNTVVVSSPQVPAPIAVRYAWADNPDNANLTGRSGLLASPFRTDEW